MMYWCVLRAVELEKERSEIIKKKCNTEMFGRTKLQKSKRYCIWYATQESLLVKEKKSITSKKVTTLVERVSRYSKLIHNTNKYTKNVIGNIERSFAKIPLQIRKTITFDRGTEFAAYRDLSMDVYFCNPHSPWQKGSNENFNGRLRRYLPKQFDHRYLKQELLDEIENKMNNQPRKCLGFKTPIEALF